MSSLQSLRRALSANRHLRIPSGPNNVLPSASPTLRPRTVASVTPTHRVPPNLGQDIRDWSGLERTRFALALAFIVVGVVAALRSGFAPPWLLLPAALPVVVLTSSRWRLAFRELAFLSAALNLLAFFYVTPLLPSSLLFCIAGLLAPSPLRSPDSPRSPPEATA